MCFTILLVMMIVAEPSLRCMGLRRQNVSLDFAGPDECPCTSLGCMAPRRRNASRDFTGHDDCL